MAGFLDRDTRILDMVLTSYGKRLLSRGELNFCYWTPFDDEVDYNPFIAGSASLSDDQLSSSVYQSIETTPLREATTGYRNFNASGSDFTNVHRPIFTMAQGQDILPRASFPDSGSREVQTYQRKVQRVYTDKDEEGKYLNPIQNVDLGVERFRSTFFTLELSYHRDSFPTDFQPDGFHVRVLRSGSSGWAEVDPRRDMNNDLAYSNDVRVFTGRRGG